MTLFTSTKISQTETTFFLVYHKVAIFFASLDAVEVLLDLIANDRLMLSAITDH